MDTTGKLSAVAVVTVNQWAREVDAVGAGQLFVVVDSTDERHPRAFANELFLAWSIGHAGRDGGVLLLIARKDRAAGCCSNLTPSALPWPASREPGGSSQPGRRVTSGRSHVHPVGLGMRWADPANKPH
ncbi:TPM domain-containing protein [Archangium lipolyticum]|uniref:TPM domain-containing protein n=1 Tax=Archangium lipolyticum TaxID=2970465 RepID=UPI00214A753B|nr:TPM domain-containing protein [Archangium lipolyticum]